MFRQFILVYGMKEIACRFMDWRVFKKILEIKLHFVMEENFKNQGEKENKKITLTLKIHKI